MKRVSIEEICAEAKVSKATFYKHFKNKIELAKYVLEATFDEVMLEYRSFMDSDLPYYKKVDKTIQLKLKYARKFSNEFFTEIYKGQNPELHALLHIHAII